MPESQVCLRDQGTRAGQFTEQSFLPHKREQPGEDTEQLLWREASKREEEGGVAGRVGAGAGNPYSPGIWSRSQEMGQESCIVEARLCYITVYCSPNHPAG